MCSKVSALALMFLVLVSCVSCQLNFSPGWGKRASVTGPAAGRTGPGDNAESGSVHPAAVLLGTSGIVPGASPSGDNCGTIPFAAVKHIYRLIRSEAAKLVQCQDEEYLG